MTTYKALTGIDYVDAKGKPHRVEAGATVDDLPRKTAAWLLESDCIEKDDKT